MKDRGISILGKTIFSPFQLVSSLYAFTEYTEYYSRYRQDNQYSSGDKIEYTQSAFFEFFTQRTHYHTE